MNDIIKILPESVANQIAAGEVVQRPSSVVKELLENAVDAKSSTITLIIKDGGKTLIQVKDNGIGMSKNDAIICFNRHATSKISNANDLFKISSKGFRGEALASISAISHLRLITKQDNFELGTDIIIHGNEIKSNRSIVSEIGTDIYVKNLFYNIPARRSFLKSDNIELKHIIREFFIITLSHPEINFKLFNNNKEEYNLKAVSFKKRIIDLYGPKTADKLVPVNEETEILKINGFVFKPEFAKKTRGEQFFFVNNRYIKSSYLNHAIINSFDGLIDTKYVPSYFLNLTLDPSKIDINVHPTKTEIKFEDEQSIYAILRSAVKHSIGQFNISPVLDFDRDKSLDIPYNYVNKNNSDSIDLEVDTNYNPFIDINNTNKYLKINSFKDELDSMEFSSESNELNEINFRDLENQNLVNSTFQLNKKYIINRTKGSLIIINQERAHQRILYESYLKSITLNKITLQKLLHPIEIEFTKPELQILKVNKKILTQIGIDFTISENKIKILSLPAYVTENEIKNSIDNILFHLGGNIPIESYSDSDFISKILSKSMSIKNGMSLDKNQQLNIVNSLFACKESRLCPSKKKIYIEISKTEIDNMF